MAVDTIADVSNPLFCMAGLHVSLVVAGEAGVTRQRCRMAGSAGVCPTMADRESMRAIVGRRTPGRCLMAPSTVGAKQTLVVRWVLMAPYTLGRCTHENTIGVASQAGQAGMSTGQGKSRLGVVESDFTPGVCHMAGSAILPKGAVMMVILLVAGITNGRGSFENIIDMAFRAIDIDMGAGQQEWRLGMIKRDLVPGGGDMACSAILPQSTIVTVIFLVAGETSRRRAFEDIIDVAIGAIHADMGASQGESRLGVVESDFIPCIGHVAGGAILPKAAIVVIIFLVAGKAGGRGAFEYLIDVALGTYNRDMRPG